VRLELTMPGDDGFIDGVSRGRRGLLATTNKEIADRKPAWDFPTQRV